MKKVEAIVGEFARDELKRRVGGIGVGGITLNAVAGFGRKGANAFVPKIKLTLLVPEERVAAVVDRIESAARSGAITDGRIFVSPADDRAR